MGAYHQGASSPAARLNREDWKGWVWPVPLASWDMREPEVSSQFGSPRGHGAHAGVDIMYRRIRGENWGDDPAHPIHSTNPHYVFIMPAGQLAIAAGPGKVWDAKRGPGGLHVIIDHGNVPGVGPLTTYYQHLLNFVKPWQKGDVVKAGEPLGEIGDNPSEGKDPRHLHFEMRFPVRARDPEPYLKMWPKIMIGAQPP